ncbi:MAG: TlpA family protein disulfide reductase [Cocleimonas sp.]|nr:TlpA family protein disulfide reductase [Cocleimonas sp.]
MFNKSLLFFFSTLLIFLSSQLFAAPPLLKQLSGRSTAPDFELADLADNIHRLADYKGKPLVINFWATWCPPCRKEMPSMNRAWKQLKEDGIQMLAINIGEDEADIHAFKDEHPIDFTTLLDPQSESLDSWRIKGLPTTYIISPKGVVAYSAIGPREWDDKRILDKIRALKTTEPVKKEEDKQAITTKPTLKTEEEKPKEKSFTDTILDFFK